MSHRCDFLLYADTAGSSGALENIYSLQYHLHRFSIAECATALACLMSFSYVIDRTRRLGAAALTNRVDAAVFVSAARGLYLDEDWEPGMNALWDLRFVDELVISPEDVPDMVDAVHSLQGQFGDGRAAFVAPHEPVHSIARLLLLQTQLPQRERRVFRQLQDALDWLDVALPDGHRPTSSSS